MACRTNTGQDILSVIEALRTDTDLLKRFVQGENNETVPLGDPIATPTPTLRHLAKNVLDAIDYFSSQWSAAADPLALDSYAFNVRRSRILPDDVVAGTVVTLPVTYYPTRDILLVSYRGEILTPRKQDDWNPGERQYEEVVPPPPSGTVGPLNPANFPANQILVSFDMEAGSTLDCWVVASNLMKEMGTLLNARDVAVQAAETATEQAAIATEEREFIQALIGDAVLELGVANIRASFRVTQAYAIGDTMTFPNGLKYYPKRDILIVTYKGQICTPYKSGQSDNYMYSEVGTDPTVEVNQIVLNFPVNQGDPFDIMVWASAVGRNIDAIQELSNDVKVAASNAVLAAQSVFNKADKYFATPATFNASNLRELTVGTEVSILDFTNAGLPGGSIYSGRIDFDDGSYLSLDVDENSQNRFALKDAGDNVIQLFYAQANGWNVISRWEFPTPVTVTTALDTAVPAGPSVWDSVTGLYATATPIDPQYNYFNKPQRDELQSLVTDLQYSVDADSVTETLSLYNALTKVVSQAVRNLPVLSNTQAGIMTSDQYTQIQTDVETNSDNIEANRTDINTIGSRDVVNSWGIFTSTPTALTVRLNTIDLLSGTSTAPVVKAFPVASNILTGALNSETYQQIYDNATDIAALKGQATLYAVNMGATQVTNQATIQAAYIDASNMPAGTVAPNGTTLMNLDEFSGNGAEYTFYTNSGLWTWRGQSSGSPATNSSSGYVKGSATGGGKIYVEADSTMSMIGYDDIIVDIDNLQDLAATLMPKAGGTFTGDVTIASPYDISFGAVARQMLNLYNTTYGIGVQSDGVYFRTGGSNFHWHYGGVHSNSPGDPGAGGTRLMSLSVAGVLSAIGGFNGNAATATKLATARTISLTGDVTGSASFDGSGNISIATNAQDQVVKGTTAPSNTNALWINTSDKCLYYHNGTTWVRLTGVYQENAGT